jgi:hypothetical protein
MQTINLPEITGTTREWTERVFTAERFFVSSSGDSLELGDLSISTVRFMVHQHLRFDGWVISVSQEQDGSVVLTFKTGQRLTIRPQNRPEDTL